MILRTQACCTNENPGPELQPQLPKTLVAVGDRAIVLRILLQSYGDAQNTQCAITDFAVELSDLRMAGVSFSDLRYCVAMGYVEHLLDVTPPQSSKRRLRVFNGVAFKENSCFALTGGGLELALHYVSLVPEPDSHREQPVSNAARLMPVWNLTMRELRIAHSIVKRFLTRADNQIRILNELQEHGWPSHIDDPLPPNGSTEPKRRLHDTINKLNQHQVNRLIQFRGDGTG